MYALVASMFPFTSTARHVMVLSLAMKTGTVYRTQPPLPNLYSMPLTPILSMAASETFMPPVAGKAVAFETGAALSVKSNVTP